MTMTERLDVNERKKGVAVLVFRPMEVRHEVLLLKRATPPFLEHWFPVEGLIDPGEKPKRTALRELEEETGLVPSALYRMSESPIVVPSQGYEALVFLFVAFVSPDAVVVLNEEHSDLAWCSIDDAQRRLSLPTQKSALATAEKVFISGPPPTHLRLRTPEIVV